MRFIDEYRDPSLIRGLLARIGETADSLADRVVTLMEVCGTHTQAIARHGLKALFPRNLRLISGPGCPVCVTSTGDVDAALHLAGLKNVTFATFGDMLRVPGSGGRSLQTLRASGADVRVVSSAADCLAMAEADPARNIVFMGIGFETTSPTVASAILAARKRGLSNLSAFSVHKVVPPVLQALLDDPALHIDGFLCPGHVSTITGTAAYERIPVSGRAAVITGFEPADILEGVLMLLRQIAEGTFSVEIQYARGVKEEGNARAREILERVFCPSDAEWRGLGTIPGSGLQFREEFGAWDARTRYPIPEMAVEEIKGCSCGEILRGVRTPEECPLFRRTCTPSKPVGPCMVSSEGTCAAHFKYS
ncbi:MAG: hydrogenase formation protein HypD [Deltaproteobacteria bacterium HGW-Deltaproteobacteria-19]|jgi:hydrogenase expression/formation protein HypD|nr:MAG: hydrogenase formation protein HypD [Deltaproteobacteria bacterium HGW-Deltaproteobacteria-19]